MRSRNILFSLAGLALAAGLATAARAERFSFAALGDTAYNLPGDLPAYEALIGKINAAKPAFSIHVGDIWGAMACTEANYRWSQGYMARFDHPLVYTPGDNEWTDCRKPEIVEAYHANEAKKATPEQLARLRATYQLDNAFARTSYADPVGGLATLRKVFFDKPQSQGGRPMPLVRQPDVSEFKETVENARWEKGGVVFATISVPGSMNGFAINSEADAREAIGRNRANVAWIKAAFAEAKARNAKAVVIIQQAGMFEDAHDGRTFGRKLVGGQEGPFFWVAYALREEAAAFARPVLLINGDFHDFVVDRPFLISQGEAAPPRYANITRLQVFGAPELKAVKVTVDTDTPWVFGFEPLY